MTKGGESILCEVIQKSNFSIFAIIICFYYKKKITAGDTQAVVGKNQSFL